MSDKDWIVEAVAGGWRMVNRLNPQEAVRQPDEGFAVTVFATEAEATALCNVLRAAS